MDMKTTLPKGYYDAERCDVSDDDIHHQLQQEREQRIASMLLGR